MSIEVHLLDEGVDASLWHELAAASLSAGPGHESRRSILINFRSVDDRDAALEILSPGARPRGPPQVPLSGVITGGAVGLVEEDADKGGEEGKGEDDLDVACREWQAGRMRYV